MVNLTYREYVSICIFLSLWDAVASGSGWRCWDGPVLERVTTGRSHTHSGVWNSVVILSFAWLYCDCIVSILLVGLMPPARLSVQEGLSSLCGPFFPVELGLVVNLWWTVILGCKQMWTWTRKLGDLISVIVCVAWDDMNCCRCAKQRGAGMGGSLILMTF